MRTKCQMGILVIGVFVLVISATGCGGGDNTGGGSGPARTITSVAVFCAPSTIQAAQTSSCSVTVTGTGPFDTSVTWSVDMGSIDSKGNYTAPNTAGTATVKATSKEDSTKSGTATVTITARPSPTIISVTVSCNPASLQTGHSSQCSASVHGTGTFDPSVTWSADVGLIDSNGLYTAPDTTSLATVKAASKQDPTKSGTTTVMVTLHSTVDQPDDVQGDQVHVLYVIPSDGTDHSYDRDGSIATSVESWNQWFAGQTLGSRVRLDTHQGTLDITFVKLHRSDSQMQSYGFNLRDEIESELLVDGFDVPNKLYLAYFDGGGTNTTECGGGALPPALPGTVAALYLNGMPTGAPPCNTNPFTTSVNSSGYREFAAIHEIIHTLGFVPSCAPHFTLAGHVSDSNTDLMYAGSLPWLPSVLDFNHDDYYMAGVPGCLDVANSDFLDPLPQTSAPPPGWPYTNLQPFSCANENTIRSMGSTPTNIEFANGMGSSVNVYWLDGTGTRQLYKTLGPFEGINQPTFVTHYWVVTNSSGQCLNIYSAASNPGHAIVR